MIKIPVLSSQHLSIDPFQLGNASSTAPWLRIQQWNRAEAVEKGLPQPGTQRLLLPNQWGSRTLWGLGWGREAPGGVSRWARLLCWVPALGRGRPPENRCPSKAERRAVGACCGFLLSFSRSLSKLVKAAFLMKPCLNKFSRVAAGVALVNLSLESPVRRAQFHSFAQWRHLCVCVFVIVIKLAHSLWNAVCVCARDACGVCVLCGDILSKSLHSTAGRTKTHWLKGIYS